VSVDDNDFELAARVAGGDVDAWAVLYDRYASSVYAFAAHLLGRDHAEDVVQESFIRLWRGAARFDPARGAFSSWFYGIVRHHIQDQLRHRRREERLMVASDADELLAEAPIPGVDVPEAVWRRERGKAVLRALQSLPPDQRRVLVLAYFGVGLSQTAIADYLGWPLGTVKKRTRLGLQKLRHLLDAPMPSVDRAAEPKEARRDPKEARRDL
jgi:RNA polymerase sigma-70 factor, ECF subfamily